MAADPEWAAPRFVQDFVSTRLQQGNDAHFKAVVSGAPPPEVAWTAKGRALAASGKFLTSYDPASGRIGLTIRDLGPGDEGDYTCKVRNDYGSISATLSVNPDLGGLGAPRCLSPRCARATLQRQKVRQQQQQQECPGRDESGPSVGL